MLTLRGTRTSREAPGLVPEPLMRLHRHGLMNVLIVGGTGEERVAVARAFHRESDLRRGPLLELGAVTHGEQLLSSLCSWLGVGQPGPGRNPLWAGARGTLFLDDVTRLSSESQPLLLELLRRPAAPGGGAEAWCGRLIVGSASDPRLAVADGEFSAALLDCLDKVRVAIGRHPARDAA